MQNILEYKLLVVGNYTLTVAQVVGVFMIWLAATLFLRVLKRVINRGLSAMSWDQGRRYSLILILQYVVWILAITAMLEFVGIHVSVLVAGSAAILVGLGLGVQQIFRDIISGIFLLFEGTIEVGDIILIDGVVGKVSEINLRTSKIQTKDGKSMIVPNHKFITENVVNWSHQDNQPTRFSVSVGVHYDSDERIVHTVLMECALEHPDVISNDPDYMPKARLSEFTDEKMRFDLNYWTFRKFEADQVSSDLRYAVREKLRPHGVNMLKEL